MNLVLVDKSQCGADDSIALDDRQARHLLEVLKVKPGSEVSVGIVNGPIGRARVSHCNASDCAVALEWLPASLADSSPPKLPLRLLIALPRPKVARRLVQTCAELGIAELHFINSYRVEKSYWQSPLLEPATIEQATRLGLEQCRDSQIMRVEFHSRFKPFIEDVFPALVGEDRCLLAHPKVLDNVTTICEPPHCRQQTLTVVVGPEGGFIDYEVERLLEAGCEHWQLGKRIYRVETVVPLIVGQLAAGLRE